MLPITFNTNPYLLATPYVSSTVAVLPLVPLTIPTAVPSTVVLPTQYLMPSRYFGRAENRETEKEKLIENIERDLVEKVSEKNTKNENEKCYCGCSCCKLCQQRNEINISLNSSFCKITRKLEEMREDIKSALSSNNKNRRWENDNSTQIIDDTVINRRTQLPPEIQKSNEDKTKSDEPKITQETRPKSPGLPLRPVSSGSKPIWMPTGQNYYTRPNVVKTSTTKTDTTKTTNLFKEIPVLATNDSYSKVIESVFVAPTNFEHEKIVSFSDNTTFNSFNCTIESGNLIYAPKTYNI